MASSVDLSPGRRPSRWRPVILENPANGWGIRVALFEPDSSTTWIVSDDVVKITVAITGLTGPFDFGPWSGMEVAKRFGVYDQVSSLGNVEWSPVPTMLMHGVEAHRPAEAARSLVKALMDKAGTARAESYTPYSQPTGMTALLMVSMYLMLGCDPITFDMNDLNVAKRFIDEGYEFIVQETRDPATARFELRKRQP